MSIDSAKAHHTVMLEVHTIGTKHPDPHDTDSPCADTIKRIDVLIDDGTQVTEAMLCDAAETELLRQFWHLVQPHDVFFGRNVADRLAFLRRRSWNMGLIPSPEVDLGTVYQHEMIESEGPSGRGDAVYRSAEALASLLGLLGGSQGPKKSRVSETIP